MLATQVSFGWVIFAAVVGIGVGFWGGRYWRKKDPESYERTAGGIKRAGDRVEEGFDRLGDKLRNRREDGDG